MNSDIRVSTGYPDHPKTRKLLRRLGAEGVKAHIFLLCKVGVLRPKGVLRGFDEEVIEDTAEWTGEPGAFVKTLLEVGLLDQEEDGTFALHNWQNRNPWAFGAEERSKRSQAAANSRWEKHRKKKAKQQAEPEEEDPQPKKPKKKAAKKKGAAKPSDDPPADAGAGQLVTVGDDVPGPVNLENAPPAGKPADLVLAAWNGVAKTKGLKGARRLSPGRRQRIGARLRDKGWDWQGAINHLHRMLPDKEHVQSGEAEPTFLQGGGGPWGNSETAWVADFDFFIRGDSVDKILDGKYDPKPGSLTVIQGGMSKRNQEVVNEHKSGSDWASRKEAALRGKPASDS